MACADQHRHRSDCERLSDLGAMWAGWRDGNKLKKGLIPDACIRCIEKPKQEVCGCQDEAITVELGSVSPTVRLRL